MTTVMIFKNSSAVDPDPKRRAKRLWVTAISMLAGGVVIILTALGVRHHDDYVLGAQMIQTETELKTTGARIADY